MSHIILSNDFGAKHICIHIQNSVTHLKWSFLPKKLTAFGRYFRKKKKKNPYLFGRVLNTSLKLFYNFIERGV